MTELLLLTVSFCYFAFAVFIGKVIALGNSPLASPGGAAAFSSAATRPALGASPTSGSMFGRPS